MAKFQPDAQEIADILEDAITTWSLSHQQLANAVGCSKESVENWLGKKCLPRANALRSIELLFEHLQNGNPLPPKPVGTNRRSGETQSLLSRPALLPETSPFATAAAAIVQQFFEAIAAKQFSAAWRCLTRVFQDRRWPKGVEQFSAGYDSFIGMNNLIVAPLNPVVPPACRVLVYYEDMTGTIELPGFGKWSTAQLSQIEECCQSLTQLRDAILSRRCAKQDVRKVQVSSLFTEHAGNILQDASQLPRDEFCAAIGADSTQEVLLSVTLIAKALKSQQGRFLIDQFVPVHWGMRVANRT